MGAIVRSRGGQELGKERELRKTKKMRKKEVWRRDEIFIPLWPAKKKRP